MPIDTTTNTDTRPGRHIQPATEVPSPTAARLARPRWLSARMVVGVLIVLLSVVTGVRVISAADQTVPVLVAAQNLAPGQPLTPDLVRLQHVRLDQGLENYLTGEIGSGYIVVRPVGQGELLPKAAIGPAVEADDTRYITLPLDGSELPHGIAAGDVVDVWLTPLDEAKPARLLMTAVSVTAASTGGGGLTDASRHAQVTLAVTGDDVEESIATLVAAARAGRVYLAALPETQ